MQYEVIVELKPEVLDAEGRAIQQSLARLGYEALKSVHVAKRYLIELSLEDDHKAKEIAATYLANPVAETFSIRKLPG